MQTTANVGGIKVFIQEARYGVFLKEQANSFAPVSPETRELIDQIAKRSYAALPGCLPRDKFDHTRSQIDELIANYPDSIHVDGIAAYCRPENKVSPGFVEGLNNEIRVIQRRAYGLRDEKHLRLKVLTCMLPQL